MDAKRYVPLLLSAAVGLVACSLELSSEVETFDDGPELIWKQTYDDGSELYDWTYAVDNVPAGAIDSVHFARRLTDDPFGGTRELLALRGANPETDSRWIALTLRVPDLGKKREVDLDVELDYGRRDSTAAGALAPALFVTTGTVDVVERELRGGRRVLYRGDRRFDFANATFFDELLPTAALVRQRPAARIPARADGNGDLFVSILVEVPGGSRVDAYLGRVVVEVFEREEE